MERYLRWNREGYLSSTGSCFDIGNTISAALLKFELRGEPFAGETHPRYGGNGSLMRLAPRYTPVADLWSTSPLTPRIDEIAAGSFKDRHPPEIRGTGYVVKALEAALWAFSNSDSFEEGALMAVNLGDDADTTGAIYGQLAGAYYGAEAIPSAWRSKIVKGALIEGLADERPVVKAFAERHIEELDLMIASEQRCAETEMEMRTRSYDEDGLDGDDGNEEDP